MEDNFCFLILSVISLITWICDFTHAGESKRFQNSQGVEHKPGTRSKNESVVKHDAETTITKINRITKLWNQIWTISRRNLKTAFSP